MYAGENAVLIDDIEKTEQFMLGNLKRWASYEPFLAEDKYGGFTKLRPKYIIVTSNYAPEEIWPDSKELEPIQRRFKVINMTWINYKPVGHEWHKGIPITFNPE